LTLEEGEFDRFHLAFNAEVGRQVGERGLEPVLYTDGDLEPHQFALETAQMLREAGPWGQKFPEPVFDGRFKVLSSRIVGEHHLKLSLQSEAGGPIVDAIAFYMAEWFDELSEMMRAVYRLDVNEFRGERNLQLQILHIET
jgi:single-stranded-DNA-specific exonuclease